MTLKAEKIRIEINLLVFDTKLSFNTYPNAYVMMRVVCVMHGPRLYWKSVSCHTKSNHAVLCRSGLANSSVSFHMEMLLAFILPSSGVDSMVENAAGEAASSYLPSMSAELHFLLLHI